jgi:hypothetical protein
MKLFPIISLVLIWPMLAGAGAVTFGGATIGTATIGGTTAAANVTNGLVGWWKFDEGSGTNASDASGNGNVGTLQNGPTWTVGKLGQALTTDTGNVNSYVLVSPVAIGSSWTAAWWSYFPLATFNNSWRTMFRSAVDDHQVLVDPSGNLGMYDNHFGTAFHSSGYNINSLSGWHHVTAVGSGSNTIFYIDGMNVGSSNVKSTSNIDYIGNYQGGSQNWGTFDDVRIYNRALTTNEITTIYNYR